MRACDPARLAAAVEFGSVRAACRAMGIHHSTFYRWKKQAERYGLEMLRPRERRLPRLPNATAASRPRPCVIEQRVVAAFALRAPSRARLRDVLERIAARAWQRPRQVGRRHSLLSHEVPDWRTATSWRQYALRRPRPQQVQLGRSDLPPRASSPAAGPPNLPPSSPPTQAGADTARRRAERHLEASRPGELVQFDCFHVGRSIGWVDPRGRGEPRVAQRGRDLLSAGRPREEHHVPRRRGRPRSRRPPPRRGRAAAAGASSSAAPADGQDDEPPARGWSCACAGASAARSRTSWAARARTAVQLTQPRSRPRARVHGSSGAASARAARCGNAAVRCRPSGPLAPERQLHPDSQAP